MSRIRFACRPSVALHHSTSITFCRAKISCSNGDMADAHLLNGLWNTPLDEHFSLFEGNSS